MVDPHLAETPERKLLHNQMGFTCLQAAIEEAHWLAAENGATYYLGQVGHHIVVYSAQRAGRRAMYSTGHGRKGITRK